MKNFILSLILCVLTTGRLLAANSVPQAFHPLDYAVQSLPALGVDEYRKALTQREAALVCVQLGEYERAENIMSSMQHYLAPSTIAESVLLSWPKAPTEILKRWVNLGAKKMQSCDGRDSAQPAWQLERLRILLATISANHGSSLTEPQDTNILPKTNSELIKAFHQLIEPSWFESFLNRLNSRPAWKELARSHTQDEKVAWKASRVVDGFTAKLLLQEANRRVRSGKRYPNLWLNFAAGGMESTSFNSDPIRIASLFYSLNLEEKNRESELFAQRFRIMAPQCPPTSFGSYEAAEEIALACGKDGFGKDEILGSLSDMQERADKYLSDNERMRVYPQLAAGFATLGKVDTAVSLFSKVLSFADKNTDPESKKIGLIRLNLGFSLARIQPTSEQAVKISRIWSDSEKR
jgi:hypothetical protein